MTAETITALLDMVEGLKWAVSVYSARLAKLRKAHTLPSFAFDPIERTETRLAGYSKQLELITTSIAELKLHRKILTDLGSYVLYEQPDGRLFHQMLGPLDTDISEAVRPYIDPRVAAEIAAQKGTQP